RAIDRHRYHEAAQVVWHFLWDDFCDWYLEIKKLRFTEGSGLNADWRSLLTVFENALRLLHPVMPFVTEELWQRLVPAGVARPASIAIAAYPEYNAGAVDAASEADMQSLQAIVGAARNLVRDLGLDPKQQHDAVLYSTGSAATVARAQIEAVQKLAGLRLEIREEAAPAGGGSVQRSTPEFDLVLRVSAAQNEMQRKRLEKEIEQLEKVIANSHRQLGDEKFLGRAPANVVEVLRRKLADYESQLEKSRGALAGLAG
ncbi:MAG TPA: class I tRNA ligase family protein, partial [Bryobacteraceae bacterium]